MLLLNLVSGILLDGAAKTHGGRCVVQLSTLCQYELVDARPGNV